MAKKTSEEFGRVRKKKTKTSEDFGRKTILSEVTPEHTLTIRQAHKKLENEGFLYTERAVYDWCYPAAKHEALLSCARDVDGSILVTPASVDGRIEGIRRNNLKKQAESTSSEAFQKTSEEFGSTSEDLGRKTHHFGRVPKSSENDSKRLENLEQEVLDLKITNRGKDEIIKFLKEEHVTGLRQTIELSRTIGQLETKLKMLGGPKQIEQENNYEVIEGQGKQL